MYLVIDPALTLDMYVKQASKPTATTSSTAAVVLTATASAPTFSDVAESCGDFGIPERRHKKVSCTRKADVPARGINIGLQGGNSIFGSFLDGDFHHQVAGWTGHVIP